MKRNLGSADRIIRIALGVGIVVAGIIFKNWWGIAGLVFLATAAVGTCPIYLPFGISTRRKA
jgi:hypothetical protein